MAAASPSPSLTDLAELIHNATVHQPGPSLLYIENHPPSDELSFGFWAIPPGPGHILVSLIGFRAPQRWAAVGVCSSGRMQHLDQLDQAPSRVHSTVIASRTQGTASVLSHPDGSTKVLTEPPVGRIADVLSRVLGLPTPPPADDLTVFIDLCWLERILVGLSNRPSRGRSWRWLADRHPLRSGGPVPAPSELAARTARHAEAHGWSSLRDRFERELAASDLLRPPGGDLVLPGQWFDDGAFSRWVLADLAPAEELLPELLAALPPHAANDLLSALVGIDVARACA